MTVEAMGIDSCLFVKLSEDINDIPDLISRRRFDDRCKSMLSLCNSIRERMTDEIFIPFAKAHKRIETDFSQLCDQFMIAGNCAKETGGLFTRIIGKISAFTILQYITHIHNRNIGMGKYALIRFRQRVISIFSPKKELYLA